MAGKVLVIGGNTGIGETIATVLSDDEFDVTVVGISSGEDVTTMNVKAMVMREMLDNDIRHIVYNAGVNVMAEAHTLTADHTRELYNVNVFGAIDALGGFAQSIRLLDRCKDARFVAVGSVSARIPMTNSTMYCSSKAALLMACRCVARELGPRAMVNTVSPGPVKGTQMTKYVRDTAWRMKGMKREEAEEYQLSAIPMRRRVTKAEVANAVVFLLSPWTTGITGEDITVSGGL